jgi:hypothetical protein
MREMFMFLAVGLAVGWGLTLTVVVRQHSIIIEEMRAPR